MRNLFLLAKHLSNQENESKIKLKHFQYAAVLLEPSDDGNPLEYQTVMKLLTQDNKAEIVEKAKKYSSEVTTQKLEGLKGSKFKEFADDVSAFLKEAMEAGIDLSGKSTHELFQLPHPAKTDFSNWLGSFNQIKQNLRQQVFGQDHAIEEIVDQLIFASWAKQEKRPHGVFLFLGPPATGKTFLSEKLAQQLPDYSFRQFDMTQFTSEDDAFGLVGLLEGYKDAKPGSLTQFVKDNPKSIIVFDEFDKAHTKTHQSLLSLLSVGTVKDGNTEETVDFTQCIVIFTTNLGSAIYNNSAYNEKLNESPDSLRKELINNLAQETKIERNYEVKSIQPEFMSRLSQGSVLLFNKLPIQSTINIATKQLEKDMASFSRVSGVELVQPSEIFIAAMSFSFAPFFDLREIKSRIGMQLLDPITDHMINHPEQTVKTVEFSVSDTSFDLTDLTSLHQQLRQKRQTLNLEIKTELIENVLHYTIVKITTGKLSLSSDFSSASGLLIDVPETSFDDISGHNHIKARLKETVCLYKNKKQLDELGVHAPTGILLYGPPGTGKTMLAKAFANEAELPIINCTGSDLLSEEFIQTVFQRARDYAPCIIFIDEIDALASRGAHRSYGDAQINRLLTEIDGFNSDSQDVLIIAATNFKDKIDPALIRSGRIDLHFKVPHLDKDARRWFIKKQLGHDKYDQTIDQEHIITVTAGMNGADLQKSHREALLRSVRENQTTISQADLVEEINIIKYGPKNTNKSILGMLEETAYHEAAHAVVSKVLLPNRGIEQISVVPHQDSLGMVSYDRDQELDYTKDLLFSMTCVALAGRAAQIKKFGDKGLDSGASQDIKQASYIAWRAIAELGMHEDAYNLGISTFRDLSENSTLFQQPLENMLNQWVESANKKTDSLIDSHWDKIKTVAKQLLEHEILNEKQLLTIMNTK